MRGASILESLLCICLLMFVLAGFFQVFLWCVQQIYAEYSSYIAARSRNLGFAPFAILRSARLAALGMSGKDQSVYTFPPRSMNRNNWYQWGRDYLQYGRVGMYGIHFEYWDSRGGDTPYLDIELFAPGTEGQPSSGAKVALLRASAMFPSIGRLLHRSEGFDLKAEGRGFDHSRLFLESGAGGAEE